MLAYSLFTDALPYDQFLATYGVGGDRARWDQARGQVELTADHLAVLKSLTRELHVLVLAGAWCGDCAGQCPVMEAFAAAAPVIKIRYLDRDASPAAQDELKMNGGHRVPMAVFFSEDGHEVFRYGEKTLTAYRKAGQKVTGGTLPDAGTVAGDWLREFERAHWVVRLSPRLRKLHGD